MMRIISTKSDFHLYQFHRLSEGPKALPPVEVGVTFR